MKKTFILLFLFVQAAICLQANLSPQSPVVQSQASKSTDIIQVGVHAEQGLRPYMEDVCVGDNVIMVSGKRYIALFDGHGGAGAAEFAAENLHRNIEEQMSVVSDKKVAIENAFAKTHEQYQGLDGSTAVVILLDDDGFYIANVGDSHAVLAQHNGNVVRLTEEHSLQNEQECQRIQKLGGWSRLAGIIERKRFDGFLKEDESKIITTHEPISYLNGRFMVTRTIGDKGAKLEPCGLVPKPFINWHKYDQGCKFILLASDGVWDVMTSQGAVAFVEQIMKEKNLTFGKLTKKEADSVARDLVNFCINHLGSTDNVSAVLVPLHPYK